jgi:UDP-N-acetylglucosamine 2-epimerase (non-hydrolysing)
MMKMAPLLREMGKHGDCFHPVLIHTGQHYLYAMSQVFFEQLHMPNPDYNLEVGSGSHHTQTAEAMSPKWDGKAAERIVDVLRTQAF